MESRAGTQAQAPCSGGLVGCISTAVMANLNSDNLEHRNEAANNSSACERCDKERRVRWAVFRKRGGCGLSVTMVRRGTLQRVTSELHLKG